MKKIILTVMLFVPILLLAESTVKVRDFCFIDGLKENQLIGYGIVAGLQGSGDSKLALTNASMKNLLKNMGISDPDIFKSKNA
ncbi:MAG TPA: flagellar basal body P-ring protein FlgI, partial [Spirochaetota bacterium]|nr:flagellar basal body P-ring protein FlgI [Spirochaetota bacterium]